MDVMFSHGRGIGHFTNIRLTNVSEVINDIWGRLNSTTHSFGSKNNVKMSESGVDDSNLTVERINNDYNLLDLLDPIVEYFWSDCYASYSIAYPELNSMAPHKAKNHVLLRYHNSGDLNFRGCTQDSAPLTFTVVINVSNVDAKVEFPYLDDTVSFAPGTIVVIPPGHVHPHRFIFDDGAPFDVLEIPVIYVD